MEHLTRQSVEVDGYAAHYYEGGADNAQTIVLLHGLGDDKNSFAGSVVELATSYRVILPDLQAHGENSLDEGRDYSIRGQVEFLHALTQQIGVSWCSLVGNSMGGHTAAAYACHHPDEVQKLVLLNATGMQLKDESVYMYYPDIVDRAFIDAMFSRVFAGTPNIPDTMVDQMIVDLNPKIPFMNRLIASVENGEDFVLNKTAKQITAPTLVLWGKEDPVVPLPYAEAYVAAINGARLEILENAGHSPQLEIPCAVEAAISAFLSE